MKKIFELAKKFGIKNILPYGEYIAKVDIAKESYKKIINCNCGKLVLVTAMTSNASGIGKTTISIGLADALNAQGHKTLLALREPSMGPVFGIKGGATGGGKSVLLPSDEINLHFTGDFHAVAQANNLLASVVDNHIFQGNVLEIDTQNIFFKRCLDVNDRSLREIEYKIGDSKVKTGFNITAASEVMAALCLSENLVDLKQNLGNILVAKNKSGKPIYARDLGVVDAMVGLLCEAFKPNLVQTAAGTPALVHMGPFANIAHGCNSVVATKFALSHADFCVTEAGFGSDLGAEKFLDIKCQILGKTPEVAVLVVTLAVVLQHGKGDLLAGFENVKKHIQNLKNQFNINTIVAINQHKKDDKKDLLTLKQLCEKQGVETVLCQAFDKGGKGCESLAKIVAEPCKTPKKLNFTYDMKDKIEDKIFKIATKIYGAKTVTYSKLVKQKLQFCHQENFDNFFVNIAKTQFSFTDNKNLLGAPKDFDFYISDIEIRSGAKMIVAIAGNMLLMPGLGKNSNYLAMHLNGNKLEGIF